MSTRFSIFPYAVTSIALAFAAGAMLIVRRSRRDVHRFMTSTRLSIMDKEVQRACRFLETHHADQSLTLDSIAEGLITGPAFLEALFRKELGMGVVDFLEQVRVNRVKYALTDSPNASLSTVAVAAGFETEDICEETFVRLTGLTVDEFRRVS